MILNDRKKAKLVALLISDPATLFKFVKSSNLLNIAYNRKRRSLDIEFHSGAIYRYYKVDIRVYNNLKRAASKGKYFWRRIRRKSYRYRRIR